MSKIKPKYIDIGTGTNQLKDATIPSITTATNYTPAQVGTEGNDKISAHLNGINTKLGTIGAGDVVGPTGDANTDNRLAIFDGATGKLLKKDQDIKVNSNAQVLASNFIPSLILSSATGTNAVLPIGPKNYFLTDAGLVSVSGFNSGNSNGAEVSITNSLTTPVTLLNNSGPASDKLVVGGTDLILNPGETVNFIKNGTYNLVKAIGTSNSSGSGSKNYLATVNNVNGNGNFELGTTAKWSLFTTTLTSGIPTGSITAGAASISSFAAVSANKLAGDFSLEIQSSSLSAGQGFISDAFTLDAEDRAKAMAYSFYYQLTAGVAAGNSTNTFAVYLYDVANSQWVQPSGVFGMGTLTGIAQNSGQFQTSANATSYRLAVVCINSFGSAITARFDDFKCGPSQYVYAAPVTDWVAYTPTITLDSGSITNYTIQGFYRQVGDSYQIKGCIQFTGANTFSGLSLSYPNNATIDISKLPSQSAALDTYPIGICSWTDTGSTAGSGLVVLSGTTRFSPRWVITGAGFNQYTQIPAFSSTSPVSFGNTDTIKWELQIPVVGKSSSIQMSDSSGDGRIVAMSAAKSTAQSIPTGVQTVVTGFTNIDSDVAGGFNSSTGVYTIQVSGQYDLYGSLGWANTSAVGARYAILRVNGVVVATGQVSGANTEVTVSAKKTMQLKAGDQVTLVALQHSGGAMNTHADANYNQFFISRIAGPTAIAASESVYMLARTSAGQSIPTVTNTIVTGWTTKDADSHNCFNMTTGVYTVPIAGTYQVNAMGSFELPVYGGAVNAFIEILVNGSVYVWGSRQGHPPVAGYAPILFPIASTVLRLKAGDTVSLRIYQDSGSSRGMVADPARNYLNLVRIGL